VLTTQRRYEEKSPLGRPRRRWKDNIKIDLKEIGNECVDSGSINDVKFLDKLRDY
jgi:hypothetical protein